MSASDDHDSLSWRRKFLELPTEERRKIMRRQAEELEQHYEDTAAEREELQGGDIIAYE